MSAMKKSRLCLIFLFIAICSETTHTVSTTKSIISTTTKATSQVTSLTRSITTTDETETTPTPTAANTTASTTQTATTTTPTTTTSSTVIITTTTTMPSTETTDRISKEATTETTLNLQTTEVASAAQTTDTEVTQTVTTTAAETTKTTTASSYSNISTAGSMAFTTSTVPPTAVRPVAGGAYMPNLVRIPSTETPVTGTAYKPKLDKLTIKLDFKVKIGLPFIPEFNDSKSREYKKLKTEFHDKLTPLYQNLTGFKSLTILGFRPGSTIADHRIDWDASIDVTSEKLYTVSDQIQNLTIANSTVKTSIRLDINAAIRTISDKCNAEDVCGSKFDCIGGTTGIPSCVCKSNYCKNAGICNVISKDDYMCSCPTTDDYVYSGDNCELRTKRGSTLRESTIIGLAAGLGGGVILMIIIIFAFHRCSKRKRNKYRERQSDAIDLPELSFPNLDKMRISKMAAGNQGVRRPNYGFEPETTDLRYHRGYDHCRDQGTFFERRGKDMPPPRLPRRREEDFDDTMSHTTYDELDAYETPDSGMDGYILPCPDYAGSSNLRRSSYDQLDEPTDRREYGQIRSRNDPSYQPLFSGNSRDGDSANQRVKKDNPYLTVY